MHGEEDDLGVVVLLFQLANGVQAVQLWHGDVGDDHIRSMFFGRLQQGSAVLDHADELELRLQDAPHALGNDHVVIEAQPDEGIVTGRGMSNVGKEGLNAINSGGGLGGLTIKLMMDGALVAQAVLDSPVLLAALGDEISAQLNLVAGQAPVYGRG